MLQKTEVKILIIYFNSCSFVITKKWNSWIFYEMRSMWGMCMKCFKKIAWFVLFAFLTLIGFVILTFKVDDMTLYKGKVYDFNDGWTLMREDGSSQVLDKLPFSGTSKPEEKVVIENRIPKEYRGKSMSFLSADKMLSVFIDGEQVYEFGMSDERSFGRTPGSVINFIDIPYELEEGEIRIEMISPYADYAAKVSTVTIGNRDVLILKLFMDNALNLFCGFVIIVCGIGFAFLFIIQRKFCNSLLKVILNLYLNMF